MTAGIDPPIARTSGRVLRLLSCIRWEEVLLLQATLLFGALFSIGPLTLDKAAAMAVLLIASCCLAAHIFAFNDWSGMEWDLRDPNRAASVFLRRGVKRNEMGRLCAGLAAAGLFLLVPLGAWALGVGMGIVILSALYSAPRLHLKGAPLAGSALHFAGGFLYFLLAWSLFRPVDMQGFAIGAYFALGHVAGHLTHESRDWEADHLNQINTNAVTFGRRRNFMASLAVFTVADALLAILALRNIVPRALIVVVPLYLLQLFWSLQLLRAGLTFAGIRRMQWRYRMLYAGLGLIMVATMLPVIAS